MVELKTFTIECRPDTEEPEDWADVLRAFKGVTLDLASSDQPTCYFTATDEDVARVKTFLASRFKIEEL